MVPILLFIALIPMVFCERVVVDGTVHCDGKPHAGAVVKLYDRDTFSLDDLIGKAVTTGKDGTFKIDGKSKEVSKLDPYLYIFHDCDDGWKPCQRQWRFGVPSQYLNDEKTANPKIMHFGDLNLNVRQEKETRDCIHKK